MLTRIMHSDRLTVSKIRRAANFAASELQQNQPVTIRASSSRAEGQQHE